MFNNQLRAKYQTEVLTVEQWREFIAGGRSKTARPCANNTTARLIDNGVAIRLHNTDIVTLYDNGDIVLNSGGWRSLTTKERINRYTNAGIYQRQSVWYMADGSLFVDGIKIHENGTPVIAVMPEVYERKIKELKKLARAYAKGYVEALKTGKVPYPSGADCWVCTGFTGLDGSLGSHVREHIEERYYVPYLLVNAGRSAGYQDHQIGLMGLGTNNTRLYINPEQIIYKFVLKQLMQEMEA